MLKKVIKQKTKMTIIFYRYEKGRFTENDGWHKYDRSLIVDRIRKQDESVTYKALIRGDLEDNPLIWHELDLTKSRLFHKQLTIFDAINEAQK